LPHDHFNHNIAGKIQLIESPFQLFGLFHEKKRSKVKVKVKAKAKVEEKKSEARLRSRVRVKRSWIPRIFLNLSLSFNLAIFFVICIFFLFMVLNISKKGLLYE
jgi:hypothetical protein